MQELLDWIDNQLLYHEMMLSSLEDEPESEEFSEHNIDHMRLTQLRKMVESNEQNNRRS